MREFLGSLAILAIMICAGLYFAGWLTYDQTADRATIEIKTREIQDAADRALEQGEAIIDKAVEPDTDAVEESPATQQERNKPDAADDAYRVTTGANEGSAAVLTPVP